MVPAPATRPPLQRRSRESQERMLAAGQSALDEHGIAGFTVQEVSRRSGLSVGAIYARFENKDELFRAVQDRVLTEIEAEQEARLNPARYLDLTAPEVIEAAIVATTDLMREHVRSLRALILRGASDQRVLDRGAASSQHLGQNFTALILSKREAIEHADPELAADMAFRLVYGTCIHRVAFGDTFESPMSFEWDVFVRELTAACTKYLLSD